jgi:transcriptional regulator with XRE-family HTH domain
VSDNELGRYLRARREAVQPADVGLAGGVRRRTPGLRRAELATLAGVSVEYLTRLEQGRDRRPSVEVLGALADALRLAADERIHLYRLLKVASGSLSLCSEAAEPPAREVRPSVRSVLDRLEPAPAVLLNRLGDVLARTTGYERLVGPVGLLDAESPNVIRFVFADARSRTAYPEWDRIADEYAAHLRTESSLDDPHVIHLVEELTVTAGAPFADRLAAPPDLPRRAAVERLAHPGVAGELRLVPEVLELPDAGQRLIVYLPADDATSAALDMLTGERPVVRRPADTPAYAH